MRRVTLNVVNSRFDKSQNELFLIRLLILLQSYKTTIQNIVAFTIFQLNDPDFLINL